MSRLFLSLYLPVRAAADDAASGDAVPLEGRVLPQNALVATAALLGEPVRVQLPAQGQVIAVLEVRPQNLVEVGMIELDVERVAAISPVDDLGVGLRWMEDRKMYETDVGVSIMSANFHFSCTWMNEANNKRQLEITHVRSVVDELVQQRGESPLLGGEGHPAVVVGFVDGAVVGGAALLLVEEAVPRPLPALDRGEVAFRRVRVEVHVEPDPVLAVLALVVVAVQS